MPFPLLDERLKLLSHKVLWVELGVTLLRETRQKQKITTMYSYSFKNQKVKKHGANTG